MDKNLVSRQFSISELYAMFEDNEIIHGTPNVRTSSKYLKNIFDKKPNPHLHFIYKNGVYECIEGNDYLQTIIIYLRWGKFKDVTRYPDLKRIMQSEFNNMLVNVWITKEVLAKENAPQEFITKKDLLVLRSEVCKHILYPLSQLEQEAVYQNAIDTILSGLTPNVKFGFWVQNFFLLHYLLQKHDKFASYFAKKVPNVEIVRKGWLNNKEHIKYRYKLETPVIINEGMCNNTPLRCTIDFSTLF